MEVTKKILKPEFPPSCPVVLATVLSKCFEYDPEKRPTAQSLMSSINVMVDNYTTKKHPNNATIYDVFETVDLSNSPPNAYHFGSDSDEE